MTFQERKTGEVTMPRLRQDAEEKAELRKSVLVRSPNNQVVPWALLSAGIK